MRWRVDDTRITTWLAEMVRIDSVNPGLAPGGSGEAQMAAWLLDCCPEVGLEVRLPETEPGRPNVVAVWPGTGQGRSLLLTGHPDTVSIQQMTIPPFEPRVDAGRMYGRGTLDMKGGLAAILGAVAALKAEDFQPGGDIILGFVTDEEYISVGTEALAAEVKADAAILTEPTGGQICIAHRGYAWLTLTTQGRAAHGSLYDVGVDAIAHMGRLLADLETLERTVLPTRSHPLLGRPSVHASEIGGGIDLCTYPDRCTLRVEHRLLPGETGADTLALWDNLLKRHSEKDPRFYAEVHLDFERPGYEIDQHSPIVQTLDEAYRAVTGDAPDYMGMRAWLDSAILGATGIPTVILGPSGEGMHAAVEYVELASVARCAAVIAEAASQWTS